MELGSNIAEVYHYCNLSRFLKIAKNRELWLVDLCKSNDGLERELIFNQFSIYWRLMKAYCKDDTNRKNVWDMVEEAEKLKSLFEKNDFSCGVCFSSENDLLSQWRGYANDGQGVSIGFNSALFNDSTHSCAQTNENKKWRFGKVEYDQKAQLNIIGQIYEEYFPPEIQEVQKCCSILLINDLWEEAMFFKHISFAEEKEYRFIVHDNKLNKEEFSNPIVLDNCIIHPREWFARDNNIVAYRRLDFSNCDNPITSVTIGPKANVNKDDVEVFLRDVGFDTDNIVIKRSVSSYR